MRFHAYPVTLSQESCHPWGALLYIPQHIVLCIESTKILDIGRNFSYFLKLQYESRRLSSYLLKVNIDHELDLKTAEQTDEISVVPEIMRRDETRSKISAVCSAVCRVTDGRLPTLVRNVRKNAAE